MLCAPDDRNQRQVPYMVKSMMNCNNQESIASENETYCHDRQSVHLISEWNVKKDLEHRGITLVSGEQK